MGLFSNHRDTLLGISYWSRPLGVGGGGGGKGRYSIGRLGGASSVRDEPGFKKVKEIKIVKIQTDMRNRVVSQLVSVFMVNTSCRGAHTSPKMS